MQLLIMLRALLLVCATTAWSVEVAKGSSSPMLLDPTSIPFVPMGFYSAEPLRASATNIREFHEGPNAVTPIGVLHDGTAEPTTGCDASGACGWDLVEKWLDRSDAVGSAVFFPLDSQYSAAKSNSTAALEAISTIVAKVKHHRSIVGWCKCHNRGLCSVCLEHPFAAACNCAVLSILFL